MDWGRVPADTMVVESKNITLRDVNAAANGVDTAEDLGGAPRTRGRRSGNGTAAAHS